VNNLRLAATVILARPARNGLEIYLTRRSARSAFAPDAFVFPGGTVDEQDLSERAKARTLGLEPQRLQDEFRARIPRELPTGEPAIDLGAAAALSVAALRELFEEAGVAVVRTRDGEPVDARSTAASDVQADRARVRNGELTFADFLESRDWYADARALAYFSHWITPPTEPRRYNTHFFFATAPHDQTATADTFETHDGIWIAPSEALARSSDGQLYLVYPTIKHLERLRAFDQLGAALDFARRKPVLTIMPFASPDEGFEMPAALENAW
jgi:8-oxo-dGTP pyrophosphatase MutT (NUDIX family)